MLSYVKGNLLTSPAHVLVNTVNTMGVMGKGIAKSFKSLYPDMFVKYQEMCEKKEFNIGKLWLYKTSNKWILNFPTKRNWRLPSKIEYIEEGLKAFAENYAGLGITSIAFLPLGCGNGELNWEAQVKPLMEKYLKGLPIDIFIYLYDKSEEIEPEHKNIQEIKKWLRSEPRSLAFSEVWEDLIQKINLIEINFATDRGSKYSIEEIWDSEFEKKTDAIIIKKEPNEITIGYHQLQEIWSIIRNYGFIVKDIMPLGYDKVYNEIIDLLLKLPYCKEVYIGKTSQLDNIEVGVQINELEIPANPTKQFELHF